VSKIDIKECLYIETWVRTPGEVADHYKQLRQSVADCNELFIRKIEAHDRNASANSNSRQETGPQGELNRIIAGLDFSELP
jgi:hypothetical protein